MKIQDHAFQMIRRCAASRSMWTCLSTGWKRRSIRCRQPFWIISANAACVFESGSLSKPPRLWLGFPRSQKTPAPPDALDPVCPLSRGWNAARHWMNRDANGSSAEINKPGTEKFHERPANKVEFCRSESCGDNTKHTQSSRVLNKGGTVAV